MADLNLNDVLVLALALEIIETNASLSEMLEILEGHRFITTKAFNAYDLHVTRRKHLNLEYGLFNDRQLRAIQIKNVLNYLEENTVYVPENWGKAQEEEKMLFDDDGQGSARFTVSIKKYGGKVEW